jgi:hypothetical protein
MMLVVILKIKGDKFKDWNVSFINYIMHIRQPTP